MHGGALAQKASKQKELSDHKLVKASNKGTVAGTALAHWIYIERERETIMYKSCSLACVRA